MEKIAGKTKSSLVQEETGCPERRLRTQISQVKSREFQRSQQMTFLELGVVGKRHGIKKHLMETDGPDSPSPVNTGF